MADVVTRHDTRPGRTAAPGPNPYLFVVGCQRSGTTLLQRMLDGHSALAVGYDSLFIPKVTRHLAVGEDPALTPEIVERVTTFDRFARLGLSDAAIRECVESSATFAGFVSAVYAALASMHGKRYGAEKSPGYCRHLQHLGALFPMARVVNLIRDGRDVALSVLDWGKGPTKLELFEREPVATCALWWRRDLVVGRRDGAGLGGDRYTEVRYEALVDTPEPVLRRLCVFLDLEFDPAMLAFHEGRRRDAPGLSAKAAWLPPTKGLRDWRGQMAERDVELFEAIAGDVLGELGYERRFQRVSPSIARTARSCFQWWSQNMHDASAPVRAPAPPRPARRTNPFVFIVGCPRSGTTLLKRMVDAHADIAITPETHWVPRFHRKGIGLTADDRTTPELVSALLDYRKFANLKLDPDEVRALADRPGGAAYAEFVAGIFDLFALRHGKTLAGDKTPGYVQEIPRLHGLWPDAKFVHLIRDGRDVCLSVLDWDRAPRTAGRYGTWADDPVATTALWWERMVRLGREAGAALGPQRYLEVRYEELVADGPSACRRICDFLGLPFDEAMVSFHEGRTKPREDLSAKKRWAPLTPGLREWRRQMTPGQLTAFEAVAGPLLDELGYSRGGDPAPAEALEHARVMRDRFCADRRLSNKPVPHAWR